MSNKDFSKIPANACTLVVGEFKLGDNGDTAKSAPMRLVARSGKAIDHPYWGRIVHDLAGMKTHKPRLPIDYLHDGKEVIGYLNKFDISSGDLVASGALVPFKDNDRATEILFKVKAGVPYEASINFGGDGIKIEEVPEGFVTQVNGYELEGPAVVVREWPLRGVAVCPYGADMYTESKSFASGKEYAATVITTEPETTKEEASEMSDKPVEVVAEVETPEAAELEQAVEVAEVTEQPKEEVAEVSEADEAVEEAEPEAEEAVEQPVDEPEAEPEAEEKPEEEPKAELSRTEFLRIVDEFGADVAAQTVKDGGDYTAALKLAYDNAQKRIAALEKDKVSFMSKRAGTPSPIVGEPKEKARLFKSGK